MDEVKLAFLKVKQDIFSLGSEINQFKLAMEDIKLELRLISSFIEDVKKHLLLEQPEIPRINQELQDVKQKIFSNQSEFTSLKQEIQDLKQKLAEKPVEIPKNVIETPKLSVGMTPTHLPFNPTIRQITPTQPEIPTDKLLSQLLKSQKLQVSTGNRGVPTDRQTNQQTNQHIILHINKGENPTDKPPATLPTPSFVVPKAEKEDRISHIEKAAEILDSLDALKKEIRRKFKALTSQEIAVFSLLYHLEEQGEIVDYPLLSSKLGLSESSIRDYILKIQKKGIPITKEKLNNKRVLLHISPDLKKIASLDTILKLREI